MTQESTTDVAVAEADVPPAKPHSRTERLLVWGGILLLLGVVAIEYRARSGYAATVKAFSEASDENDKALPMHLAESMMALSPSREHTAINGIEKTYAYTWLSLFRYGQFQINVVYTSGDEPSLLRFWTGAGHDPMTPYVEEGARIYSREEITEALQAGMGQQATAWYGEDPVEGGQRTADASGDSHPTSSGNDTDSAASGDSSDGEITP